MSSLLWKSGLIALGASVAESKFSKGSGKGKGLTEFVLIGTGFWVMIYGFQIGSSRSKIIEDAKKDGEQDVEERYNLPNLYAQGTSQHVKKFNCMQRSHQHILETFTQLCVAGLTAAVHFPIASAFTTLLYAIGRFQLSNGYAQADGDASKRYNSKFSKCTWYGLVSTIALGLISAGKTVVGK